MTLEEQLKKLRNELNTIANEYGNFSVDLLPTVYGQVVCFNVVCYSLDTTDLVYKVAGKEDAIKDNLRKELAIYQMDRYANHLMNLSIFK